MTSPPGSAGIPFGRERSDLEAPRAGEELATAPHRVGGAGPQPRPRSRDPSAYPQATQPPLFRRNPSAPINARSRAAGRTGGAGAEGNRPTGGRGGPLARILPQTPTRRGDCWIGTGRGLRRALTRADGRGTASAQPQRACERGRSGQRPGAGHPDEHGRSHDSSCWRAMCRRGLVRRSGLRANLYPVRLTPCHLSDPFTALKGPFSPLAASNYSTHPSNGS
jgi:hypothetical protein